MSTEINTSSNINIVVKTKSKKRILDDITTYLFFAGPGTVIFFAVIIIPFLYGVYLTFTNYDGINNTISLIGASNYVDVFKDKSFWASLGLTIKYVGLSVVFVNIIAFSLAYLLTSGIRGQSFFRSGFFTPNLVGGIMLGLIWKFIFSDVFTWAGKSMKISILSTSWLTDSDKALWCLVIAAVWQYAGYMMIIYIAGFMIVPKSLLEASSIDGASSFRKLISITIPLMIPSFVICIFLSLQRAFMVYDVNLSLTKGDPFQTTVLTSMYVYNKAFQSQQYGVGQAEAFVLFALVATVSVLQVYFTKKLEVEA